MLGRLDKMIHGLGMAVAIVLALVFAAPALASHVCADSPACAASDLTIAKAEVDQDVGCPDCGPACANGCCHSPHVATPADLNAPGSPRLAAPGETWVHDAAPPLARPAGPDRPPRS